MNNILYVTAIIEVHTQCDINSVEMYYGIKYLCDHSMLLTLL